MRLASDYIHPYKDAGGRLSHCRIRIYLSEDVVDAQVVICSELPNNPGGSIINSAEVIAVGVIRVNELPTPIAHPSGPPSSASSPFPYPYRVIGMVMIAFVGVATFDKSGTGANSILQSVSGRISFNRLSAPPHAWFRN